MERWPRRMDTISLRQRSRSYAMGVKRTLARSWVMSAPDLLRPQQELKFLHSQDPNPTLAYVERGHVASNTQRSVRCEPELATTQRRGVRALVMMLRRWPAGAGRRTPGRESRAECGRTGAGPAARGTPHGRCRCGAATAAGHGQDARRGCLPRS